MKKSLSRKSISILTVCLVTAIVLGVFGVSTDRTRDAGFYATIRTWLAPSQGKQAPLVGPVTVTATAGTLGPTDYATLKAAFDAINAGTHQGTISIAIVADTTEAASAVLNASGSGAASYATISIQPSGGAARTISGAIAAGSPLIDFSGADNVTIDGLNTGGNSLTISNSQTGTTAGTSTIRYINDATSNTIQNATVNGAATGASTGTIIFSNTTGTTGNDNNTVTGCNIGPVAATFPTNAIFSSGTTTSATTRNSGISVTNNNIFDFYNSAGGIVAGGVSLAGSTDWTITGNSFYQTAARAQIAGGGYIVIGVADTTGVNFIISNNFIGGSAASAGGAAWTETGATTHTFIGIRMSVGSSVVSSLQNNTIQNINNTTATTSTINAGIAAVTGAMNIGTTTGNTIGATTGTGSITWTSSGANQFAGILAGTGTPNGINISNNRVGSLTVGGTAVTTLYGIRFQGAATLAGYTVSGNVIGSTSTANSITNNSNGTFVGISGTQTLFPATVSNNTIQNLQVTSTGSSASLRGIELTGSISGQTISGNTIANFSTTSTNTATSSATAIVGITLTGSATSGNTITTNTIRDLSSTTSGATAVYNQGIVITSTPGTTISRNFIFNLTTASTSATSSINGIQLFNSSATENIYNNMIRLGVGVGNNPIIRGIYDNTATSSPTNIYFNSIYIDGTQGAATVNTACISKIVSSTMDIKDNILWNNRASTGAPGAGTGRHYGIQTTSGNPTSNYNDIFTPNNGGAIGFSTSDQITLANWRTATSQDLNSQNSDPKFQDATNATTPDLHINPTVTTFIEGNGILVSPPTDDFDGQTRSTLTPVDIGADAGNFMGVDLTPPVISYTPLANTTSTSNRALASTITDGTGVPTVGAGLPVIYYRKGAAGAFSSTQSTSGGGSAYNFTIDYSLVTGGSVTTGDTIQYYVVAQDTAATPNVIANPSTGASGYTANPPAASTPPTTPSSYMIVAAIAGTKTVGTGGDYPTLTGVGGLFADINSKVATSNLVIQIISDLTVGEDGTNGLNPLAEEPTGSNFTVMIFPTGANRAITGTNTGALIRLNAADRVTVDGSIGGTGTDRSMIITNTNTGTTSAVVWMQSNGADGATNNTIKNLNVAGSGNTQTLIGIGSGSSTISTSSLGTGNNGNTIQNNNISKTQYGIYSQGASAGSKNTGNVITQNLMNTASPNNVSKGGILVGFENSITISQNTIDGISNSVDDFGIMLGLGTSFSSSSTTGNDVTNATVSRNIVGVVACTGTNTAFGIAVASVTSGTNQISNNALYGITANSTSPDTAAGIFVGGGAGSTTQIYFNSVSMTGDRGTGTSMPGFALAIQGTTPVVDIRNNILYNTQTTSSTGKSYSIGLAYTSTVGNYTNLTSNNNDLFGTGTAYNVGVTGSLATSGTDRATLAAWFAETGRDSPSAPPNSSISQNPQFNSATNLQPQAGSPVIDTGTSLSALVSPYVDITGATRVDPPSMGAYETGLDGAPPVISYTVLANTTSTANRMLSSVVITDSTGVNTTSGTRPRIYYKKSTEANAFVGNTSADNGWKFVETSDASSPFSFTLDYSLLTSAVVTGDMIQYFVVAQDTASPVNVGINSGTFATAPTSVSLGAAQAPIGGTINSYQISIAYAGSFNVGSGETVTSLTNPGGMFAQLNSGVLTGNVTINLTSDLTAETGSVALNQWAEQGAGGYTLTIKPSGAARSITSTAAAVNLIKLNGASRVTIDGSLSGGTDRSLTIENIGTTGPNVVWFGSIGTTPITNDTLKNCTVRNGVTTSSAVVISDASVIGNPGYFSNVTVQNNSIQKAFIGVYANGGTSPQNGSNLTYTQNTLNTSGANSIRNIGLYMQGVNGATVSQNTIGNFSNTDGENDIGIWLASGTINATVSGNTVSTLGYTGTSTFAPIGINVTSSVTGTSNSITGNSVSGITSNGSTAVRGISVAGTTGDMTIEKNNVQGVVNTNTSTYGAYGMDVSGGNNIVVRNNFISNVNHDMTGGAAFSTTFGVFGIRVGSGTGLLIYHNSVNLYGAQTGTPTTSLLSAAFCMVSTASTGSDVRNNIFANSLTGGTTSVAHVSIYLPSGGTAAMNLTLNNNAYFNGTDAATQGLAQAGTTAGTGFYLTSDFNPGATTPATNFRAYSSTLSAAGTNDNASQASTSAAPFVSSNDLHLNGSSSLLGAGAAIASVTNDYDMDPRPATNPDIGADELVQAVAGSISAGTFYNALTADGDSLGGNVSITNVIYLNGKLSTGANTLAIGCNASVSGGGPSNYVIGNLKKTYCATGSKSFEVGTANGFSPVTVNVTAGTFPADFTTKAVQGAQPNIAVPAKALSRYWTLTATGVTADLTFNYLDPPDVPGTATEGNFVIFKYNGSFSTPGGTVDTNANTASITGVTSFSDWTLAEPSAEPCPLSTTPTSQNFPAAGGSNTFTVTADGGCVWTPVSNDAFITIDTVSKPTGVGHAGNGTVNYSVAANTGPARMGTVTIGVQTFTVTQNSGCSFMLSSTSQNFVAAGGMDSVNVTAGAGCMWTAVSNDAFITINSGTPGSGNGSVGYAVAANTGPARMGTMTIAGITFTVTQNSGCTFMLSSTSQNFVAAGGMNSVMVTSGTGCGWTAVSNDAFITVDSGTPGSGNGTVGYTVAANTGPARMGTMTIAGITFTVTQNSGCTFMLTPTSQNFTAPGGSNSVNVTQTTSCSWTAVSNDAFIIIDSGTPGSGNGTVGYHVTANTGPMRSGSMTIAGITFNVTQDAACAFNLSSLSQHFVSTGGMDSVNVITGTGCTWTAVSNDAFITVNSGTPGSGNGTVGYTVAANMGPARMGTMTIAGITFTVSQDSGCMFTLSRDHQSFAGNGGSGSVNVIASDAACPWTASTSAAYIHITSGTPGTGNGALMYTVDVNPGPTIRNDTITIGGQTYTVYQGINFLDVPSNDLFYNEIGKLAARGVTVGCGGGNYCPNDSVLREQMAAFILRAKGEFNPPTPASQRFTDVPPANVFYNFIDRLAVLGITVGCNPPSNTMYCPGSAVTREQMSAFLLRGLGEFSPPTPASQRFNDVPPANVFYNFIDRMAVLNITLGCTPDHLFYCPSDPVTRAQMAAFLVRAFDL